MKYSVALVSVFVATAFAIPQSNPLDVIPQCAQSCALSNVGSSGCDITSPDIAACLCGKPAFQQAFADCVTKAGTCTHDQQCKLYTDSQAQCAAAKVPATIPQPGGAACPGAPSSGSGSGSGSGTTTAAAAPPAATTTAAAEPEPTTPAETTPAAEPTTAAAAPTGNSTAPSVPAASSPSYSNNAGTLAAKGGAAVLAVFVAVFAL